VAWEVGADDDGRFTVKSTKTAAYSNPQTFARGLPVSAAQQVRPAGVAPTLRRVCSLAAMATRSLRPAGLGERRQC